MNTRPRWVPTWPVVALAFVALAFVAITGACVTAPATSGPPEDILLSVEAGVDPRSQETPLVIATTTILGDLTQKVVGDEAVVEVLMGPGQDPHSFAVSARQRARMGDAVLVVANGLGLEAGMTDVLAEVAVAGTPVLTVGDWLEAEGSDNDLDPLDPHVWLDPSRMATAVGVIADHLDQVVAGPWQQQADVVARDLMALDRTVAEMLASIEDSCRVMVTNHDSLGYFADRYDLEVATTIIPGTSTDVEPNARDFAALVEHLRDTDVPAVFVEETSSTRLAEALAAELGRETAVVTVPIGALGPAQGGTDSYEELMTTLARRVVDALADCHNADDPHEAD